MWWNKKSIYRKKNSTGRSATATAQGKSTVLQIIAGGLKPTSGHVFIPPHLQVLQAVSWGFLMGFSIVMGVPP